MLKRERGFTLIEILVCVTIIGVIVLCAIPSFAAYRRQSSCVAAGNELRGILRGVRSRAISRGSYDVDQRYFCPAVTLASATGRGHLLRYDSSRKKWEAR